MGSDGSFLLFEWVLIYLVGLTPSLFVFGRPVEGQVPLSLQGLGMPTLSPNVSCISKILGGFSSQYGSVCEGSPRDL